MKTGKLGRWKRPGFKGNDGNAGQSELEARYVDVCGAAAIHADHAGMALGAFPLLLAAVLVCA